MVTEARDDGTSTPRTDDAEARARAERRVALLSAFARGIICEFDGEFRYRDVWFTDERLLAMPAKELIGRTIIEAVGEEVGRALTEGTKRVYDTGTAETFEYTLPLAAGPRVFEAEVVRIRAEGGPEPYRAAALIRDITEEKAIERKLAEAERLAALGVLAAGVGHEINNPLMVVQENARLALRALASITPETPADTSKASTNAVCGMLADVLQGVQRMQRIVADLRVFRLDDGQELVAVDVRAALETAVEMTRGRIQQRAVLERDLAPVPLVTVTEGQLDQVFVNLLVNATQAIPEGDARSHRIRAATRTDAKGWAVVEISDTGCGISPGELGRILDPFYTTKREGMGLGLSICHRIVTGLGGTITVDSQVGHGTTFRVSLPPRTAEAPGARGGAQPRTLESPRERLRLLLVDDDPVLLRVLSLSLGEEHDVVAADGCHPALTILHGDAHFDGILCDLMMPLGDGMTFYEMVGRLRPELLPRVVFMTGGAFTARARSFLESIPNKTIEKPFGPEALRRVLRTLPGP